jgi:bacterioferritin-associated ferredoxin
MACTVHPTDESMPWPPERSMTRCECSGVPFDEAARRMAAEGLSLDELSRRTGCGGNCSACVPDLRRYLEACSTRR